MHFIVILQLNSLETYLQEKSTVNLRLNSNSAEFDSLVLNIVLLLNFCQKILDWKNVLLKILK